MSFQPVFNKFAERPTSQSLRSKFIPIHAALRDQLTISTWLLIGAMIQGIAFAFVPYRNVIITLPVVLLGYKLLSMVLTLAGVFSNPYMEGAILSRTTPIFPGGNGTFEKPAEATVCAILLGIKSNHPLGVFAPGFIEIGNRFADMMEELANDATTHGFLGSSSWISACDRTTSSETMSILYFENEHYLHQYAHGPMHTKALQWWREAEHKQMHIGIMHEVFACPKNSWEAIYVNYQPTGLGATSKEVTGKDGTKTWVNPLVKVEGKLHLSKGRMGRA